MNISWYGHSCFKVTTKGKETFQNSGNQSARKDASLTLVLDPFDKSVGLTPPRFKADIVFVSHNHPDHNYTEPFKETPLINEAGEYEIKGIFIKGIKGFHDKKEGKERGAVVMFKIEAEGISLVHLGDLGQNELSDSQIEELGQVDILLVPVGGKYTIGPEEAQKVINQIEPRLVIPMHYKIRGLNLAIAGVEPFLKTIGAGNIKPVDKLSVKAPDLKNEDIKTIIFEAPRG
jgi:L-ascorbate metabolism protein UlaG (beta-lactamase superfamily)